MICECVSGEVAWELPLVDVDGAVVRTRAPSPATLAVGNDFFADESVRSRFARSALCTHHRSETVRAGMIAGFYTNVKYELESRRARVSHFMHTN